MLSRLAPALCLGLAACGSAPPAAVVLPPARLVDLQCPGIACTPRWDQRRGDASLELAGALGAFPGKPMILRLDDVVAHRVVMRQTGATAKNGHYAASIPLYELRASRYEFLLMPDDGNGMVIAVGYFTLARGSAAAPRATQPPQVAMRPPAAPPAAAPARAPVSPRIAALIALVGTWRATAGIMGTIEMTDDGRYAFNGQPAGHYKVYGNDIVFDGRLAEWNGGRATVTDGHLDFYWTGADGAQQWYSFAKGS